MADSKKPFMTTRRGFFKSLFGKKEPTLSLFAIQLAWDAFGQDEQRRAIRSLINSPDSEGPDEKRAFYKKLTSLVREAEPYFEYACFEYTTDLNGDPEAEFHAWVGEIEAGIATEEEELGEEVDGYHRMSNENGYIAVSIVLLFEQPHPLDGKMDEDEDALYTRANLGKLLHSINLLNFERIVGDAAFVVPSSDEDGLSWSDLASEDWAHLRTLND